MTGAELDSRTPSEARRPRLAPRGALLGASAGAVIGLCDALRALAASNEVVQPADAPRVAGFYAIVFAVCGLGAALVARAFDWPRRALHLLVLVGSVWFFVTTWVNVTLLPGFTSPLAIVVDIVLVMVAVVVFRRAYLSESVESSRSGAWAFAGVVALGISGGLAAVFPVRDGGPAPQAAASGASRPNVLVYVVDTLRADHLQTYGYAKPTSAEIDSFAKESVVFQDCRSPTSWTKPAVASLLTSLYPTAHACVEQREILVPEAETLPEIFAAAGWRTGAFSDNPFVSPEFGFGQGFATYDTVRPSVVVNGTLLGKALFMTRVMSLVGKPFGVGERADRGCEVLHASLLRWIEETPGQPWFAYVHAMEPHLPYEPLREDAEACGLPAGAAYETPPAYNGILPFTTTPEPSAQLRDALISQYDGEIRGLSRGFGRLVQELRARGQLERTVVVFTADHGEEFHEHGGWTHGHSLHREVVQVPLIVRLPDASGQGAVAARGRRVGGTASLLDVFPTLLDASGVVYPKGQEIALSGRSLMRQLTGTGSEAESVPTGREILGEVTMSPVGIRSIRDGRWLLIVASEPLDEAVALYDDVGNPGHTRDRRDEHPGETAALREQLDQAFDALKRIALLGSAREIDPETAERLRKLGYAGGK